jgi:hypothetical protein
VDLGKIRKEYHQAADEESGKKKTKTATTNLE